MKITPIPLLSGRSDNYGYLIHDPRTGEAAVVDPVEPEKVLAVVKTENAKVVGILTTHHHGDHAGGNAEFVQKVPNIKVWGGDDRIEAITTKVTDNKPFKIGSLEVTPLYTICHTTGSVSYYVVDPETNEKAVFTGDTLFIGGCGRFFEGTADQMHNSLINILGRLPPDTKVYCGHEYTKSNLKFAQSVDPSSSAIQSKLAWAEKTEITVPSTIAGEFTFNPFMRVGEEVMRKATGKEDEVEVMAKLRELKNNFKG
ncbi:hypothetical protein HK097_000790 [Rhizophlyctis rosea]|uniref:hydroxyacylglutathione hydrolase n=1 Tax=Rhizophlyctis rosea TaxID=64517 RepID=A0AAD5X6Z5_9FUNG|nr:hypothetical protein HK097_000790 [Rhizophlyctis rosea]